MHTLVTSDTDSPSPAGSITAKESLWQIFVLCFMTLLSLLMGLLPHVFLNPFLGLLEPFIHVLPPN